MAVHHDKPGSHRRKLSERRQSFIEALETRRLLSGSASDAIVTPSLVVAPDASASSVQGLTPAQIKAAYAITGDGTGQTIAIVDAYSDPNIVADLAVFDAHFGLSAPASFKQESATGGTTALPAANAGWDTEISLDVEWAHAIAPKANIILVDAASSSLGSLLAAVNYARKISSVSVISMSWGTNEFSTEKSYDSYFTTPAGHIGITFVAASGDEGASSGAEWPAVSSNVLSVGGTTLTLSSAGSIASETAWSDGSGGSSRYETLAVQSAATGSRTRTSPDVSYDANPNTGFAVYDSIAYEGYVGWQEVGGTSAGAPQWAGIIAIADSARVAARSSTLTTAQTLGDIYSIYEKPASYSADFSDITAGSSLLSGGGFGGPGGFGPFGPRQATYVSATTGYDILTGVGSPKGAGLISALTSTTTSTAASTSATAAAKGTLAAVRRASLVDINPFAPLAAFQGLESAVGAQFLSRNMAEFSALGTVATLTSAAIGPNLPSATSATAVLSSHAVAASSSSTTGSEIDAATATTSAFYILDMGGLGSAMNLRYAAQIVAEMSFPPAANSPIRVISPELGRVFRETMRAVEEGLVSLSSSVDALRRDSGGLNIAMAAADILLLGYCYGNRNRGKLARMESLFNDDEPIGVAPTDELAFD